VPPCVTLLSVPMAACALDASNATQDVMSLVKMTSSKKRRLRMQHLAEAKAKDKFLTPDFEVVTKFESTILGKLNNIKERLTVVEHVGVYNARWNWNRETETEEHCRSEAHIPTIGRDVTDKELHERVMQVYEEAQKRNNTCPGCGTANPSKDDCWCDYLVCAGCDKMVATCTCPLPKLKKNVCDNCDLQEFLPGLELRDFSRKVFNFHDVQSFDEVELGSPECTTCPACSEGRLSMILNTLDEDCHVCDDCHGVNDQDSIQPCDGAKCISEGSGMHHISCMIRVAHPDYDEDGGAHLCRACHKAGILPAGDSESSSSSTLPDEHDLKNQEQYENIYAGMPYFFWWLHLGDLPQHRQSHCPNPLGKWRV